jgi:NAD-dependent deacetylase
MRRFTYPVAFTGAGISVASGLPTFNITWKGLPVRSYLTREFFERDPVGFYEFFREVEAWNHKEPNDAHRVLAVAGVPVVTQNIDGLHQKAGSEKVIEIHGNLREMVCPGCGRITGWKPLSAGIPVCSCGNILKPRVVLFGDDLLDWPEAVEEMRRADLVLVVGSSLEVAPACYLPQMAQANGAELVMVNEKSELELPKLMREFGLV